VINGVFERYSDDVFARAYQLRQEERLRERIPLVPHSLTRVESLRKFARQEVSIENEKEPVEIP
jgi:hypothetical protein